MTSTDVVEADGDVAARFFYAPIACSSFTVRFGVPFSSAFNSSFMIVLVGMFGVSFSKPPCMKIVESTAQIECLNLYKESNFFHSDDSVS